jgi:hypothetical protein
MYIFILTIILLGIVVLIMGVNIFFRKKKFPETHVGHNKDMRRIGVVCAKTMDRIEQKKAKQNLQYKNIRILK